MKRGDLYLVKEPPGQDPRKRRVFVIVSREAAIRSNYSSLICAPVYTAYDMIASQVAVGIEEGLKHESSIHCDNLVSVAKSLLTNYIGTLSGRKLGELNAALKVALGLD